MTEGRNLEQPKPATDEMVKQAMRDQLYRVIKENRNNLHEVIYSLTYSYWLMIGASKGE